MSLLSHHRYQYVSLIVSKQTWAYPRQQLQQLLWCVVSVRLNLPEVEERKLCPLRYYANCVSTTLTVFILHNVGSVYFFYSNPVFRKEKMSFWEIVYMKMYLILIRYSDRFLWISRSNSIRFLFVALDVYKRLWMHKKNSPLVFWMLLPSSMKVNTKSDEQHTIIAREMQRALSLTVGFFKHLSRNTFFFHLNIKLKSN